MGIPGLTTYILKDSERYLDYYMLHDSYLVIDGINICCQLYTWHARCNCAFGGDYDKYAQCVRNFFDELLICNITPLVLIDGGCEDKKLKTMLSRTKQKTEIALKYTISSQHMTEFLPLLLEEVFKDVMNEKGIRYAQCIFEADNTTAAIARILNCPVLSYDSDFFIYGSLYIPFNTLEHDVVPNPTGRGYMKRCKIYCAEKLFQVYHGLNQPLLFLAAVLLGNDYVEQHKFKNFFRHLPQMDRKRFNNERQRRINDIFQWLRRRSLNEAVIGILSKFREEERKHVLNTIETIMNGYINAPLSVLHTLGLTAEIFSRANMQTMFEMYKFEDDICNLTYIDEYTNETQLSDEETEDEEIASILEGRELVSNESLVDNLPKWFIHEFKQSRFSYYFIDLITRKLYVCPTQIEDPSHVSSIVVSLKVIGVIYGLLMSGVKGRKTDMEYITRDENNRLKRYQLEYSNNMFGCELPSLLDLRELPIVIRKEILNTTLAIFNASYINEIPSNWMLYIATMKYWIDQQQEPSKFSCHVYALLFALLFNVIDYNIGFYRILSEFNQRFNTAVDNIRHERKTHNYRPQYSNDVTLADAVIEVNANDCLLAAAFFVSNFEVDQKLYSQPKKFNIAIVHGFAEFQNCLKHIIHLNALLGYPYEQTNVATLFNGTLLYNLCSNFKERDDIEVYINLILRDSPSLSRLFNVLLSKVKPLLDTALESKVNKCKKQKTKRYKEEESITHEDNCEEENQPPRSNESYVNPAASGTGEIKTIEQGVQGLSIGGSGGGELPRQDQQHPQQATAQQIKPEPKEPRKITWASVASQPVKPVPPLSSSQEIKKKAGMPSPPIVPGKHNIDIGTWGEGKSSATPPPTAPQVQPPIPPPPPPVQRQQRPQQQPPQPCWNRQPSATATPAPIPQPQSQTQIHMPPQSQQHQQSHQQHHQQQYQRVQQHQQQQQQQQLAQVNLSYPVLDELKVKNEYNPVEFDQTAPGARFFVMKAYSEDVIHRSIKYEIWCSTEHGNKRLDQAYREASREGAPLYLFFSVNGSGHFCGMAQMVSPVDYQSNSSVWPQDKWKGQFRVRWIYVKDVPNEQLRHIKLENNENKPVTNSRDAQEVPHAKGVTVLRILHTYRHSTSIFDDFGHYERWQAEEDQRKVPPNVTQHHHSSSNHRNRGHASDIPRDHHQHGYQPHLHHRKERSGRDGRGDRASSA